MNRYLIIVQAPADVKYSLEILNKLGSKSENSILILVLGFPAISKLLIQFFKNNKNIEVHNLKRLKFNFFNPISLIQVNKILNSALVQFKRKFNEIYFFSKYYDYTCAFLISQLTKEFKSKIFYVDHYDSVSIKDNVSYSFNPYKRLKYKIISLIISFTFQIKFVSRHPVKPLEWNLKSISYNNYKFSSFNYELPKIHSGLKENSVLFLLSPGEIKMLSKSSKSVLKDLIKNLKSKNISLVLKGHPRMGTPKEFKYLFESELDHSIPIELVDFKNVKMIVGIISTALIYIETNNEVQRISLIDFLEFKDKSKKEYFKMYLKNVSKSKKQKIEFNNSLKSIVL